MKKAVCTLALVVLTSVYLLGCGGGTPTSSEGATAKPQTGTPQPAPGTNLPPPSDRTQ